MATSDRKQRAGMLLSRAIACLRELSELLGTSGGGQGAVSNGAPQNGPQLEYGHLVPPFGKYGPKQNNRSFAWILANDPKWLEWACEVAGDGKGLRFRNDETQRGLMEAYRALKDDSSVDEPVDEPEDDGYLEEPPEDDLPF